MSYQVIARKYRPQRFSEVVGQDHVTRTLVNAIEQNRIAHAYLFVGPRGTGKTTLARIFAKCLNCADGPKVDFSDDDPRCHEIAAGRALDVLEIDGASNRGIEEIRELRDTIKYAPAMSRFKVYIIDEVHMLTKEAFNALLKTLEEPPAHVKFMFATTEPEKVLPTILSRCQRFDLRPIPAALIVQHLRSIALQEKVEVDAAALHAIARGAEGGMRDAESTLDQLISFCGDRIVESDVLAMFGLAAQSQILDLAGAILRAEVENTLRQFHVLSQSGNDLGRLVADLLQHFRNLMLFRITGGDLGLLEVTESEAAALGEQAGSASTETLNRILETLAECERFLRDSPSKKIWVELCLMKAVQAGRTVPLNTVLEKLRQLRAGEDDAAPTAPAPATNLPPPPERPSAGPDEERPNPRGALSPPSAQPTAAASPDLARLWHDIVQAVGQASPFARTYLLEAHPVDLTHQCLTIGFDPEFSDHLGLVDNAKTRGLIQTKLKELGYPVAQIRFIEAEAPADWVKRPQPNVPPPGPSSPTERRETKGQRGAAGGKRSAEPAVLDPEDFKNDPLIRQAIEIFKGQIVEVRA